jgi:F-type H+-transporting ATPase subunit gamma
MATLRDLKGRISSVGSTEKITGAMKMISSAKMTKAMRDIRKLLPFRTQLETIIGNVVGCDADFSSPLTVARPVRHATVVVLGSDDGLCGAYNSNIAKQLVQHLAEMRSLLGATLPVTVVAVGAKMVKAMARVADGLTQVVDAPEGVNSKSDAAAVKAFVQGLQQQFLAGETDRVDVVYMQFHSPSRQTLECRRVLPVEASNFAADPSKKAAAGSEQMYIFEPSPEAIFSTVLPLMLLSTMQEIFSENRASEAAARVMAMQSANDNAKKLLEQLRLEYNKLRQQSITTELLDILGGQVK